MKTCSRLSRRSYYDRFDELPTVLIFKQGLASYRGPAASRRNLGNYRNDFQLEGL